MYTSLPRILQGFRLLSCMAAYLRARRRLRLRKRCRALLDMDVDQSACIPRVDSCCAAGYSRLHGRRRDLTNFQKFKEIMKNTKVCIHEIRSDQLTRLSILAASDYVLVFQKKFIKNFNSLRHFYPRLCGDSVWKKA